MDVAERGRGWLVPGAGAVTAGLIARRALRQVRRRSEIDWAPPAGRLHHAL